jgi:multicomponent Na+:H+ antiporter subunit F
VSRLLGLDAPLTRVLLAVMCGSLLLAFGRLVRGPSLPDRAVALDFMAILSVGILAAYAVATEQPVLLDVALAFALIAFLATLGFARYVERSAGRRFGGS